MITHLHTAVNGFAVIARMPVGSIEDNPRQEMVVCDRDSAQAGWPDRFVCWRVCWWDGTRGEQEGPEIMWGYYTNDLDDALNDMCDRAGRPVTAQARRVVA